MQQNYQGGSMVPQSNQQPQRRNTLLPTTTEMQVNPLFRYTLNEVAPDLSENSGDIFPLTDGIFGLAKPLLMKLSVAAGIQFDPANTGAERISKNRYKGRAYGAMLLPDGTAKNHYDEKVIDLDDEEDNYRLDYHKKAIEGIIGPKAMEASKLYAGGWQQITTKKGKTLNAYTIDPQDREEFVNYSTITAMTQLRKTADQKALTGAVLRVIRALTGVKGGYTKEELAVPFAIPRVVFVPDMNDPAVKLAMIDRGLNATTAMFKSTVPRIIEQQESIHEELPQGSVEVTELLTADDDDGFMVGNEEETQGYAQTDSVVCHYCGVQLDPNTKQWMMERFGKCLCENCYNGGKR